MLDLFINSGKWGYIIIFVALIAFSILVIQLFVRNKWLFYVSNFFAVLPLTIAYFATSYSRGEVQQAFATMGSVSVTMRHELAVIADSPLTLGYYVSIPLLLLLFINLFIFKKVNL